MLKPQMKQYDYTPTPKGTHLGILYSIIDLGIQETEWKGEKKSLPKIRFTWELPNETKEFEGVTKPLVIGQNYTNSMGSKSNLRPVIEAMLGVTLRDDEASNFDIEKFKQLLGTPCLITVGHKESNGKIYSNVAIVAPLMKGMTVPKQFNENVIFEIGTSPAEELTKLPKFIQEMIMKSEEMKPSTLTDTEKNVLDVARARHNEEVDDTDDINPEDIPF
jgi:hypothetical protein